MTMGTLLINVKVKHMTEEKAEKETPLYKISRTVIITITSMLYMK